MKTLGFRVYFDLEVPDDTDESGTFAVTLDRGEFVVCLPNNEFLRATQYDVELNHVEPGDEEEQDEEGDEIAGLKQAFHETPREPMILVREKDFVDLAQANADLGAQLVDQLTEELADELTPKYSHENPHHYYATEDWKDDVTDGEVLGYHDWVERNLKQKQAELVKLELEHKELEEGDLTLVSEIHNLRYIIDPDYDETLSEDFQA